MAMRTLILAQFAALVLVGCSFQTSKTNPDPVTSGPTHPVTPKMKGVTDAMSSAKATDFKLPGLDGSTIDLARLRETGPVIVYSILDGCPCSTDFEPLANSLAKRYGESATVIGLFTDDKSKAAKWATDHSSAHPIAIDDTLHVVRSFKHERSVYVTFVTRDGTIGRSWPGYSQGMLIELDLLVQKQTGKTMGTIDTAYAPTTPASGCQIFEGEGFAPGDKR